MNNIKNYLKPIYLIGFIVLLGGCLRFYKLNWGEGYFFHPDEYHIVRGVSELSFPDKMNPHLFSYGSFTVYTIYFLRLFLSKILNAPLSNLNPFLIGRVLSAFYSTVSIIVVYLLSKELFKKKAYTFLAAILVALTPGLIQQAHFATPESSLTFWILLTIFLWISWMKTKSWRYLALSAVTFGLATGIKIVALTLLPLFLFTIFFDLYTLKAMRIKTLLQKLLTLAIFLVSFFIVFPYSILDYKNFISSMNYEGSVASGKLAVFYTRMFFETKPVLFQVQKILPYTIGPVLLLLGILGFGISIYAILKQLVQRREKDYPWIVTTFSFVLLFFSNAFLFAKWARFIAPTFTFFSFFSLLAVQKLTSLFKSESRNRVFNILSSFVLATTFLYSLAVFSIYRRHDVRVAGNTWLNENIPSNSLVLTEAGNMLEIPLTGNLKKVSFDFYNLDENPDLPAQLTYYLSKADYFIIQSRRIYLDHQKFPKKFPKTARFYYLLFSGNLGFEKIAEFTSFPRLEIGSWKLEIDDEQSEETWSVFDHPVIRVYKKTNSYKQKEYEKILGI
jgi:hypothetical protein